MKNLQIALIYILVQIFPVDILSLPKFLEDEIEPIIKFLPGKEEIVYLETNDNEYDRYYYRALTEFVIKETGQYCLWGSNWDKECQNISLKHAYNNINDDESYALQFEKLVISFIKYIQNKEYDKALKLGISDIMFFSDDGKTCLEKNTRKNILCLSGCRSYMDLSGGQGHFDKFDIEVVRQHLIAIDTNNLLFYLDDLTGNKKYDLVIEFQHENIKKNLYFEFSHSPENIDLRQKATYSPLIESMAIYNYQN